jgi:hypothetical protein
MNRLIHSCRNAADWRWLSSPVGRGCRIWASKAQSEALSSGEDRVLGARDSIVAQRLLDGGHECELSLGRLVLGSQSGRGTSGRLHLDRLWLRLLRPARGHITKFQSGRTERRRRLRRESSGRAIRLVEQPLGAVPLGILPMGQIGGHGRTVAVPSDSLAGLVQFAGAADLSGSSLRPLRAVWFSVSSVPACSGSAFSRPVASFLIVLMIAAMATTT